MRVLKKCSRCGLSRKAHGRENRCPGDTRGFAKPYKPTTKVFIDKRTKRVEATRTLTDKVIALDCDYREAFGFNFDRVSIRRDEWDELVRLAMVSGLYQRESVK